MARVRYDSGEPSASLNASDTRKAARSSNRHWVVRMENNVAERDTWSVLERPEGPRQPVR